MKKIFAFLIGLVALAAQGQEFRVASMTMDEMDLTARVNKRVDKNGRPCALLKIFVPDKITKVEGNIIGDIINEGIQNLVYVSANTKQVNLLFEKHYPLRIVFDDYKISAVNERMVYVIKLEDKNKPAPQQVTTVTPVTKPADDGESEFKRGHTYFDEGDYQSAIYWLRKASDKGHAIATSDIGLMYEYGIGVERSYKDAETYYRKASGLGYVNSYKRFKPLLQSIISILKDNGIDYYSDQAQESEEFHNFATGNIYFRIDETTLSRENKLVLKHIANEIKMNNAKYDIRGWNSTFTGTAQSNYTICQQRANAAADYLKSLGINASRFVVETGSDNLYEGGHIIANLCRAVTIRRL